MTKSNSREECCPSCRSGFTGTPLKDLCATCPCHKQTPAPEKVCKCACHENKLGKPYAHDTKCCEAMNGAVDSPAPEKKWEELFDAEFFVSEGREVEDFLATKDITGGPHPAYPSDIKSFIRQILEEKAVEVMGRKKEHPTICKVWDDENCHCTCDCPPGTWNAALTEAAAILRR